MVARMHEMRLVIDGAGASRPRLAQLRAAFGGDVFGRGRIEPFRRAPRHPPRPLPRDLLGHFLAAPSEVEQPRQVDGPAGGDVQEKPPLDGGALDWPPKPEFDRLALERAAGAHLPVRLLGLEFFEQVLAGPKREHKEVAALLLAEDERVCKRQPEPARPAGRRRLDPHLVVAPRPKGDPHDARACAFVVEEPRQQVEVFEALARAVEARAREAGGGHEEEHEGVVGGGAGDVEVQRQRKRGEAPCKERPLLEQAPLERPPRLPLCALRRHPPLSTGGAIKGAPHATLERGCGILGGPWSGSRSRAPSWGPRKKRPSAPCSIRASCTRASAWPSSRRNSGRSRGRTSRWQPAAGLRPCSWPSTRCGSPRA